MDEEKCKYCKYYSGLNGFCELEGVSKESNDRCFKFRKYSEKCKDCPDDSCDGNCDCGGKCKDKKKEKKTGCGYAGGCGGSCSGGSCTSLSVGINRLETIDISSPTNYKWEYLLEDGKDQEMGTIEVKVYSNNTTQYQHWVNATKGLGVLMKNFIFSTHKDKGYLEIENNSSVAKITIRRI